MKKLQTIDMRTMYTSLNLLDYDFKTPALQKAQYYLAHSFNDLKDRIDELNDEANDSTIYCSIDVHDPDLAYLPKLDVEKYIFYVLWSEYSGQNDDIDEDTFKQLVEADSTVQSICKEKGI